MSHSVPSIITSVALGAVVACCGTAQPAVAQHPAAPGAAGGTRGTVVETMSSGGYTYVHVDDGSKNIWAAAPQFVVAVGDVVVVPEGMPMKDFKSQTLGRTFDLIYFVPNVQVLGGKSVNEEAAAAHVVHGATGHRAGAPSQAAAVDLSNVKKADGGQTVSELFAQRANLAGKGVIVRGKVVKFSPAIMGKNWVHVQDGTGSTGRNDLTVSTSATAAVGDTVVVRGTLGTDRDLGAGYHYDIIIEDGTLAVE